MKKTIQTMMLSAVLSVGLAGAAQADDTVARPTILDFQADWCPSCKALRPVLAKIEKRHRQVDVVTVNVDDPANRELCKRYDVSLLPTVVFLSPSGDTCIITGFSGEENINWALKSILR